MRLAFDVEANGLLELNREKPNAPLSKEGTKVWCICALDVDTLKSYSFRPNEIDSAIRLLRSASLLIGHNILGFDIPFLERLYGSIEVELYDTQIISKLMYPDIKNHPLGGNSLLKWGQHLGCEKMDYNGGFDEYNPEMLKYCRQDVLVTSMIFNKQKKFVEQNPKPCQLEHDIAKIIAIQTATGMCYDVESASRLEQELLVERAGLQDVLDEAFPPIVEEQRYHKTTGKPLKRRVEHFNPGSSKMVAERLIEKYNWKPKAFTNSIDKKTGQPVPKADKEVLSSLKYSEAKTILEWKALDKILQQISDWTDRSINSRDGKIHGSVNTQGCVTGRMSASQPNLQQVNSDPRTRQLFVPRKGWMQVGIDASGLEARILANRLHYWDGGRYAKLVLEGDVHTENQKAMGLASRAEAKTFLYALVYGAGAEKMGKIVGGGPANGNRAKDKFFKANPAFAKLVENVKFQVAKKNTVKLLDGREVYCRSEHSALNLQIQGDGAVLMKTALRKFYDNLTELYRGRFAFIATVHDEWQIECEPDIAERIGQLGCFCLLEAGKELGCEVPMEGEFKIGRNWSECH